MMKLYNDEITINGRKLSPLETTGVLEALKDSADPSYVSDLTADYYYSNGINVPDTLSNENEQLI